MALLTNLKSVTGLFSGALMKRLGYRVLSVGWSPLFMGHKPALKVPTPPKVKNSEPRSRKFLSLPLHEPQCTLTRGFLIITLGIDQPLTILPLYLELLSMCWASCAVQRDPISLRCVP